jgi:hypothetical protein
MIWRSDWRWCDVWVVVFGEIEKWKLKFLPLLAKLQKFLIGLMPPQENRKRVNFLGISSLENGKIDISKSDRLSEEDFIKWTKRITPSEGDIVFSYETRLGEVALIPSGETTGRFVSYLLFTK